MKEDIKKALTAVVGKLGLDVTKIKLEFPEVSSHGDFSCNIALVESKKLKMSPKDLAEKIVQEIKADLPDSMKSVEVAGPGFINFFVKDEVIAREAIELNSENVAKTDAGKKYLVEYTDPNTFKVFHIGHLMSNAIGESIARLIESAGAKVTRICYPSDIGLHIAKAIWAIQKHIAEMPGEKSAIQDRTDFLGKMYVEGTQAYEADPAAKDDIDALNKVIYEKSSKEINQLYDAGRKISLEHFELLYKILGTKFDDYIYESDMAPIGLKVVKDFLAKGIFEESEGAVVFKGEKYGTHTRVFINSVGLPTYEAKDLGLNVTKFQKYPDTDCSIIITASEQNGYFDVLKKVIELIDEKNGKKTKHIGHGMMRFAEGKMSSRKGNVITAEALISDIEELVMEKIIDRDFSKEEKERISEIIAVGAIKYTILRSSIGSDIIFDSAASISFEGDSGPYLQYATVRAGSLLEKARTTGFESALNVKVSDLALPEKVGDLEVLLTRFPSIIERAAKDYAPQNLAGYLTALASAFNSFYAGETILDHHNPLTPYYLQLTKSFKNTMTRGLELLGIKVPEKM